MATLYDNVSRIENAKVAMKKAIVGKGVPVEDSEHIETYAAHINEIQTGPGELKTINGETLAGTGDIALTPGYMMELPVIDWQTGEIMVPLTETQKAHNKKIIDIVLALPKEEQNIACLANVIIPGGSGVLTITSVQVMADKESDQFGLGFITTALSNILFNTTTGDVESINLEKYATADYVDQKIGDIDNILNTI